MADNRTDNMPWSFGTSSGVFTNDGPLVSQKKSDLSAASGSKRSTLNDTSASKALLLGSPANQELLATAIRNNNYLGQEEFAQDTVNMPYEEFYDKYGREAARASLGFIGVRDRLEQLKTAKRTTGQAALDSFLDVGTAAVNIGGGLAGLGALSTDAVLDINLSPTVSQNVGDFTDWIQSGKSDIAQRRAEQQAVEFELDAQDRAVRREQREADGDEYAGLKSVGEAFLDTVKGYAKDPMSRASLAAEGAGSIIPIAGQIGAVARARVLGKLAQQGITGKAARDLLKTQQGRALLQKEGERVAPIVVGAVEAGTTVTETQLEILDMSEDDLMESPQYAEMREGGMSHEEAQQEIAKSASGVAAITDLPFAVGGGVIAGKFLADPLARLSKRTPAQAVTHTGRETVEEMIQEGGQEFASNVGLATVGLQDDLLEGVGEGAGAGALGGFMSGGGMQVPAMARSAAREAVAPVREATGKAAAVLGSIGSVAGKGLGGIAEARRQRAADQGPLGPQGQEDLSQGVTEALRTISEGATQQTSRESSAEQEAGDNTLNTQTTETSEERSPDAETKPSKRLAEAEQKLREHAFLDEEEQGGAIEEFPSLRQSEESGTQETTDQPGTERPVSRLDYIIELGKSLRNTERNTPDGAATAALISLDMVNQMNKLQQMTADDIQNVFSDLDNNNQTKLAYEAILDGMAMAKQMPAYAEALQRVRGLNKEQVAELLDTEALLNPASVDPEQFKGLVEATETLAIHNPTALPDAVLNMFEAAPENNRSGQNRQTFQQTRYTDGFKQAVNTARRIAEIYDQADAVRNRITEAGRHKTRDMVRNEIHVDGNRDNDLPSLEQHRQWITEAAEQGNIEEASQLAEDLNNFAQTLANKQEAFNKSARGEGNEQGRVGYDAVGPYGDYARSDGDGVYANLNSDASLDMIEEAHADATAAARLLLTLKRRYKLNVDNVYVPALDPAIQREGKSYGQRPAKPKTEDVIDDRTDEQLRRSEAAKKGWATRRKNAALAEEAKKAAKQEAAKKEEKAKKAEKAVEAKEKEKTTFRNTTAEQSKQWFNDLKSRLSAGSRSALHKYFKPNNRPAPLVSMQNPVRDTVTLMLESTDELSPEVVTAARGALNKHYKEFGRRFSDNWKKLAGDLYKREQKLANKNKTKVDLETAIEKWANYPNARGLAFLVKQPDGTNTIDPTVVAASFFAAFDWITSNTGPRAAMDNDKINQALGRDKGQEVTAKEAEHINFGVSHQDAVDSIAADIRDMLGISKDASARSDMSQGLFESLALGALDVLMTGNNPLIEQDRMTLAHTKKQGKNAAISIRLRGIEDNLNDKHSKTLINNRKVFTPLLVPDRMKVRYVGEAPKAEEIKRSVGRNNLRKLSKKENEVVNKLSNIPAYINASLFAFEKALGPEASLLLRGFTPLTAERERTTNKAHLESIKGKNQTIMHDLEQTMQYENDVDFVLKYKNQDGRYKEQSDVPIFYPVEITTVGRAQQVGPVTPQASKVARELLSATPSTIDITDTNATPYKVFWMAVLQAWGGKVEVTNINRGILEAQQLAESDSMKPAIDLVEGYLETGKIDPKAYLKAMESTEGIGEIDKRHHAIMAVALHNQAMKKGEKSFRTSLALEADGKTDGPMNAVVHMLVGGFNSQEIALMQKGGLYFSSQPMSLVDYAEALENLEGNDALKEQLARDIYGTGAHELSEELISRLGDPERDNSRLHDVLSIISAFPDSATTPVKYNDGNLDLGRNFLKNPTTVITYGSGIGGVAGKITHAVAGQIHQVLTEIATEGIRPSEHRAFRENPDLINQIARVMFGGDVSAARRFFTKPTESAVTGSLFNNLRESIQEEIAEPMFDAIDTTLGGLVQNMKTQQSVANIQGIMFREAFNEELKKATDAWYAKHGNEHISENEIRNAFIRAMDVAPIYSTDAQEFHISGPEARAWESTREAARSPFRKSGLSARVRHIAPSDTGVKVSPYLIIGTGDGRMVLNIYMNEDGILSASLPVFDGVEMSLNTAAESNKLINKSVFQGWMDGNPYRAQADSFQQMLNNMDDETLNKYIKNNARDIKRAFGLKRTDPVPSASEIRQINIRMQDMAISADARKEAMKRIPSWTDHMGGLGAAHHNTHPNFKDNVDVFDLDKTAQQLNEIYQDAYNKLSKRKEHQTIREAVGSDYVIKQEDLKDFEQAIYDNSEIHRFFDGGMPYHELKLSAVPNLFKKYMGNTRDQFGILRDLQDLFEAKPDMRIVFGSSVAVTKHRNMYQGYENSDVQLGQYMAYGDIIYITNPKPETFLHEIIHALTVNTILDHYGDPDSSPEHVRAAMRHLEELVDVVRGLNPDSYPEAQRDALWHLQNELEAAINAGNKAQAVGELIAYTLSNQDLINVAKKTTTFRRLIDVISRGIRAIRSALGLKQKVDNTLFSQIRFNTMALAIEEANRAATRTTDTAAYNSMIQEMFDQTYPASDSLINIENQYLGKLKQAIDGAISRGRYKISSKRVDQLAENSVNRGRQVAEAAVAHGFPLDARQVAAFSAVHPVLTMAETIRPDQRRSLYTAHDHVVSNLTEDMFVRHLKKQGENDNRAKAIGKSMYEFAIGKRQATRTGENKPNPMAALITLSLISEDMRSILTEIEPAPQDKKAWTDTNAAIEGISNAVINGITHGRLNNVSKLNKDTLQAIDQLGSALEIVNNDRGILSNLERAHGGVRWADDKVAGAIDRTAGAISDRLGRLAREERASGNRKVAGLSSALSVAASVFSKDGSKRISDDISKKLNELPGWNTAREFWTDLRGDTKETQDFMSLLNKAKFRVDKIRQNYRTNMPDNLKAVFTKNPNRHEWAAMRNIGLADITALGIDAASQLMKDPTQTKTKIKEQENKIRNMWNRNDSRHIMNHAEALSRFVITGENTTTDLRTNAYSILRSFMDSAEITPQQEQLVDQYLSYLMYDKLDTETKHTLSRLMVNEEEGMRQVMSALSLIGSMEESKIRNGDEINEDARMNGWKGYVPEHRLNDASIKIAGDSEYGELIRQGYTRVGDYDSKAYAGRAGRFGYYVSSVSGRGGFRQGIAQNVSQTYNGVDSNTGRTITGRAGDVFWRKIDIGRIQAANTVTQTKNRSMFGLQPGEYMRPIYNGNGAVVAYEQTLNPEHLNMIKSDQHMGRMLGAWFGRFMEEKAALDINDELISMAKADWDKVKGTSQEKQFVNIADPEIDDPVWRDSWMTMPWILRQKAKDVFGPDTFMVRRELVKDIIGERNATVTDWWTGNSRLSEGTREALRDASEAILGVGAMKWLKRAERGVQEAVSLARTNIIVRSIVVAYENQASNYLHLGTYMSLPKAFIKSREKFIELNSYVKNKEKIDKLELKLMTTKRGSPEARRVEARIEALNDANSKLSIAPLLEEGEFTSISEDLTDADLAIRRGKWSEYIEDKMNELPEGVGNFSRNVLIFKNSAAFKALNRMVQYGDFISKAVLYDHLKENTDNTEQQIKDIIREEFVNYNKSPGRVRGGFEAMGLGWFLNYKLRITSVMLRALRDRPVSSFLMMNQLGPTLDVDSVWSGSLPGAIKSGRIWRLLGPDLGFHSVRMHPLWNIIP